MRRGATRGAIVFWSVLVGVAALRVYQSERIKPPDIGSCLGESVRGTGMVADEPERKPTGQIFFIDVDSLAPASSLAAAVPSPCPSDLLIRVKSKLFPIFAYGDEVSFIGKLTIPMDFAGDDGRTFDYVGYLAKDGIYYEIKSAQVSRAPLAVSGMDGINSGTGLFQRIVVDVRQALFGLRRRFVAGLERALGDPDAALAAGLVVGDKASLGPSLLDDFRTVGLIHIVILSGYSVGIVIVAVRRMLSFLPRVWSISIAGLMLVSFCLMVGAGATVVRACSMAFVMLLADLSRRNYSIWRALLLVVLVMIIISPAIFLHDSSFQISVLATIGLILLAEPIQSRLGFITERFGLREIVASTSATQIFVASYILYVIGQLSLVSVVVNILVLPFIPATMLAVYLTGAVGFVSAQAAQAFGWIAHLFLAYIIVLVEWFAALPFASVEFPPFSGWWAVASYGAFFLVYGSLKKFYLKKKRYGADF